MKFDAEAFIREQVELIRNTVPGRAISACSGGVDSTTAAVLAGRALGDRLLAVYVDTGLMRKDETEDVERTLQALGVNHRILRAADEYFAAQNNANSPAMTSVSQTGKPSMPIWGWLGWGAAAAASLLLIVNIWNSKPADIAVNTATQSPIPERLSPAQMRDRFMAAVPSSEMVKAEWGKGNVANLAVSGDVVWSDKMQEGYLRFTNLPKNDTSQYTYQLWIFDENQDPKTPIDGGIFDVNADGEIIIPITAKLHARGAKAFAITMEKPGGVMVSDRSKIVTLGSVKPNQA